MLKILTVIARLIAWNLIIQFLGRMLIDAISSLASYAKDTWNRHRRNSRQNRRYKTHF